MNVKLKKEHLETLGAHSGNINLYIISGVNKGKKYRVTGNVVTIGRSAESDIEIVNVKISKVHAKIQIRDQTVTIIDLNSSNGTFLNGKRIKQATLKNDDKISLGGACEIMVSGDFKFCAHDDDLSRILDAAKKIEKKKSHKSRVPKASESSKTQNSSVKSLLLLLILLGLIYIGHDVFMIPKDKVDETREDTVGDLLKEQPGVEPYVSQKLDPSRELRKINISGMTRSQREADIKFFRAYNVYLSNRFNDAIMLFQEVLLYDRNHALGNMYLERAKTELEELIDLHDREGRTLYKNLNYHQAIIKFRSVMNLLRGREDDPRFKDAKKFIKLSQRKLARY